MKYLQEYAYDIFLLTESLNEFQQAINIWNAIRNKI